MSKLADQDAPCAQAQTDAFVLIRQPDARSLRVRPGISWQGPAEAILLVLLVTGANQLLHPYLGPANLVMFYLPAVVLVALRQGWRPAALAAALSVLSFNYFFVPPLYTMHVQDPQYLITFAALLLVGLTIGNLTATLREQVRSITQNQVQIMASYALSRQLAQSATESAVVTALMRHIDPGLADCTTLLVRTESGMQVHPRSGCPTASPEEMAVAQWVWSNREKAGWGTSTLGGAPDLYLPIIADDRCLGVLCVRLEPSDHRSPPERWKMLESMASLTGLALERVRLAEEARRAQLLEESQRLHSSLLNSISHDLNTPLTTLIGSLDALRDPRSRARESDSESLLDSAAEQAQRLKLLLANLLDMSRVEAGQLNLHEDYCEVSDLVGAALDQLEEPLRGRTISLSLPAQVPLVKVDGRLLSQVLVNLLDNAAKYSSGSLEVGVRQVDREARRLELIVVDHGPGVAPEDRERIFQKFVRASPRAVPGTGLGLAICRGLIDCHYGRIWVEDTPGGGATFVVELPLEQAE